MTDLSRELAASGGSAFMDPWITVKLNNFCLVREKSSEFNFRWDQPSPSARRSQQRKVRSDHNEINVLLCEIVNSLSAKSGTDIDSIFSVCRGPTLWLTPRQQGGLS